MPAIYPQIKPLLVHKTEGTVLAYVLELLHIYFVCGGFLLFGGLIYLVPICWFFCGGSWLLLAITILIFYDDIKHITANG